MKVKTFEIGGKYGYVVQVSKNENKVLQIGYSDPRYWGIHEISKDGTTECDYEFLREKEPNVYNAIINVKNGGKHIRYLIRNEDGLYGEFEKWELDYKCNEMFKNKQYKIIESKNKNEHVLEFGSKPLKKTKTR